MSTNRQQRRAIASIQKKAAKNAAPDMELLRKQVALQNYQIAGGYLRHVTEVYSAIEETLPFAAEGSEAESDLKADLDLARDMVLEARQHAIRMGFEFADVMSPVPLPKPVFTVREMAKQIIEDDRGVMDGLHDGGLSDESNPGLPYTDDGQMQGTPEQLALLGIGQELSPHSAEETAGPA